MENLTVRTKKEEFFAGVRDTFPLVVGAIPFGIIFGALAVTSGLSAGATMAMSAFVFAGSAQFVASGLVASGAGVFLIVLTTFIVNLRHALYSATLAPHMRALPQRWLLPLGFWLTDESFVVVIRRYTEPDNSPLKHWYFLGSALFMYSNWQAIPDPASWGLDFAMVVTFIGMLVPIVTSRPLLISVVTAGAAAVLANSLPNRLGIIVASLAGIIAGVAAERILVSTRNIKVERSITRE